jgi:hypothetical protein
LFDEHPTHAQTRAWEEHCRPCIETVVLTVVCNNEENKDMRRENKAVCAVVRVMEASFALMEKKVATEEARVSVKEDLVFSHSHETKPTDERKVNNHRLVCNMHAMHR